MTNEELLAKAKRDYPIGTRVNSLGGTKNALIDDDRPYFIEGASGIRFDSHCLVYFKGQWATIVSRPKLNIETIEIY